MLFRGTDGYRLPGDLEALRDPECLQIHKVSHEGMVHGSVSIYALGPKAHHLLVSFAISADFPSTRLTPLRCAQRIIQPEVGISLFACLLSIQSG